jgi:hypothetical protein
MDLNSKSLLFLFTFVAAVISSKEQAIARPLDPGCLEGLARIGKKLSSDHQVIIASLNSSDVPAVYQTPFSRQGQVVTIVFQGQATSELTSRKARNAIALLNSPRLQSSFANSIMQVCSEVDIVEYSLMGTDDSWPHFRMPSGGAAIGVPLACPGRYATESTSMLWGFYEGCNSGQT